MKVIRPPSSHPPKPKDAATLPDISGDAPATFSVGVSWVREHGNETRAVRNRAANGQMHALARVRESLRTGRTPHVPDAELPGAVQALFADAAPQLSPRHVGMQRLDIPPQTDDEVRLELFLAPNRHPPKGTAEPAPVATPVPGVSQPTRCANCPFCSPETKGKSLLWRGLRIMPNAFPYAPAESQHLLLLPLEHRPQNFEKSFFIDVMAMQKHLGPNSRMHFNGKAGNSQPHLHWHAHQESLPLEEKLQSSRNGTHELARFQDATLSHFSFRPLSGLLVEGSEESVAEVAERVVRHLEADPTVQGRYNMVLLQRTPSSSGGVRLAIFPRRSAALSLEVDGVGVIKGGALDMTGRRTVAKDKASQAELTGWRAFLSHTQVPAAEIPGLENIADSPKVRVSPWQTRISAN